jgi:hypothetical protein
MKRLKHLFDYLYKNERKGLYVLFVLAALLRVVFVLLWYQMVGTSKWIDDHLYIYYAEKFANEDWELVNAVSDQMIVGPALPMLFAFFILISDVPVFLFFAYNVLVTSFMVIVLYYFGKECMGKKVGWILAIWGVFYVEAFKYLGHILKEPTLFLFLPLTIFLLLKALNKKTPFFYLIGASLSFAWLIHTDERFFVYFPLFPIFFLFAKPFNIQNVAKSLFVWTTVIILLMLPWSIRNYKAYDQIVILSPRTTAITSKFWGQPINTGAEHFGNQESARLLIESRRENAEAFGEKFGIIPREYGRMEARLRAFINFWQPTYVKPTYIQYGFRGIKWSFPHNIAGLLFYGIFLPFYFVGFFLLVRRKYWIALTVAAIPILHSLLHAYMVWPLERYRSPITFIIVMIGIWVILELYNKLISKKREAC